MDTDILMLNLSLGFLIDVRELLGIGDADTDSFDVVFQLYKLRSHLVFEDL